MAAGITMAMPSNTFTKYVAAYPIMAGVVGGDVGAGTYRRGDPQAHRRAPPPRPR